MGINMPPDCPTYPWTLFRQPLTQQPMLFAMGPGPHRREAKEAIHSGGGATILKGLLRSLPEEDQKHAIVLGDPSLKIVDSSDDIFNFQFVLDCKSLDTVLPNLKDYRLNKSRFEEYDPFEILCGYKSWSDVNRLDDDGETCSDIDDDDVGVMVRSEGSLRQARKIYTLEDEQKILRAIVERKGFYELKGNGFWQRLEKNGVGNGHTWSSMKEHFRKQMIVQIENPKFGLSSAEIALFQDGMSTKLSRKDGGSRTRAIVRKKREAARRMEEEGEMGEEGGEEEEEEEDNADDETSQKGESPKTWKGRGKNSREADSADNADDETSQKGESPKTWKGKGKKSREAIEVMIEEEDNADDENSQKGNSPDKGKGIGKKSREGVNGIVENDNSQNSAKKRKGRESEANGLDDTVDGNVVTSPKKDSPQKDRSPKGPKRKLRKTRRLYSQKQDNSSPFTPRTSSTEMTSENMDVASETVNTQMFADGLNESTSIITPDELHTTPRTSTQALGGMATSTPHLPRTSRDSNPDLPHDASDHHASDDLPFDPSTQTLSQPHCDNIPVIHYESEESHVSPSDEEERRTEQRPKRKWKKVNGERKMQLKLKRLNLDNPTHVVMLDVGSNEEFESAVDLVEIDGSPVKENSQLNFNNGSPVRSPKHKGKGKRTVPSTPSSSTPGRPKAKTLARMESSSSGSTVKSSSKKSLDSSMGEPSKRLDRSMSENEEAAPVKKSKLIVVARKKKRCPPIANPFSREEDDNILNFILHNGLYAVVKGNLLWKRMTEKEKQFSHRTWESLKNRFLRYILPNIERYDVRLDELEESASRNRVYKSIGGRPGTEPYTKEEDKAIVEYLYDTRRFEEIGGRAMWELMEERKICPGRTWQGLKERFRKRILPNLDQYEFDEDVLKYFRFKKKEIM